MGRTLMVLIQIAILLFLLGLVGCNSNTEKMGTGEETESASGIKSPEVVKKILKILARRLKITLSRRINEMTTMVDVKSSELTLTYFYVIEDPPFGKINEDDFYEQMTEQLTEGLCNEEKVLANLKNGVTYSYNYQDNDGDLIAKIDFTIDDCEDMDE